VWDARILIDSRVLLILGIFLLDLWTPVGAPVWILYLVPLLFLRSFPFPRYPLILAGACTFFIFVAFLLAPPDASGVRTLKHRAFIVVAIWIMAVWQDRLNKNPE
jgi:hypothetical protein